MADAAQMIATMTKAKQRIDEAMAAAKKGDMPGAKSKMGQASAMMADARGMMK